MRGMHVQKKKKLDYLSRHSVLEFHSGVCFEFFEGLFENKKEYDFHVKMTSLLYMLMASKSSDLT